jgi:hypothetical protein
MAKDHVGNFDRMGWDKNQLLAEVNAYEDGHKINWKTWRLVTMLLIRMVN